MAEVTLFGIPTCDTCRKARKWLGEQGIAHRFHDLRKDGLDLALLQSWEDKLGWERLLNRQSTTWRALPDAETQGLDKKRAIVLMAQNVTLLKRPLLAAQNRLQLGFKATDYEAFFL